MNDPFALLEFVIIEFLPKIHIKVRSMVMKKLMLIFILALTLIPATPVSAGSKEPVGELMTWHIPAYTFAENVPFHQEHGWLLEMDERAVGGFSSILEVDGAVMKPSYKIHERDRDTGVFRSTEVYNFPEGMTGEHTFTGYYYVPCKDSETYTGDPCIGGGSVLALTFEMVVTFE